MAGLETLLKQIVAAFSGSGSGGGASSSKQQIIDYLKDKGYSKEATAGIVGNIDVETMVMVLLIILKKKLIITIKIISQFIKKMEVKVCFNLIL